MTSAEIRQSFLDFFRKKKHTIVPSSSLMPDSPNLLFTNAGMNQFVPIFLGQRAPDLSRWAGATAGLDTRAADTQKCIRAGGKHNDLEDVGLDTYHHTFFEMLGNWSFGDYFKKEAIEWAWELLVETWKFPAERLYATVYSPGPGDPSEFDREAYGHWERLFAAAGLDPKVHIVLGGKGDNFWMMGDTGPCGPCSEVHIDLTHEGNTQGSLVNAGDSRCIEIWNLVFIQFNANPDGTFSVLPAKHVDTGMGFERVASIIQGTRNFRDFATAKVSNYETDIFRPIFNELEKLSGRAYGATLPPAELSTIDHQQATDVAFRVIADHIRALSFAIADGIEPGNTDRNYVLRRILRRAVRYGRSLGFHEPFFFKLAGVLSRTMGGVFPEIVSKQPQIEAVLRREEETFNKTLDRGIALFEAEVARLTSASAQTISTGAQEVPARPAPVISGAFAFRLYDEQGFPRDLTELMARERGLAVDIAGFEALMEEQRARARAAQRKHIITLSDIESKAPTKFVGYDILITPARVLEVIPIKQGNAVILDRSPFYAEMGGQVGDTGELSAGGLRFAIVNTQKSGHTWLHFIDLGSKALEAGQAVELRVDELRRAAIQRHHTVTHLLHWALHEVIGENTTQRGSFVAPDKLTFDFNSSALTPGQVRTLERIVNERVLENTRVSWMEVPYASVKRRKDVMQFFGDKYGDIVRVVQIGGREGSLDGYSMELCAGTHARATGEIGYFHIVSEGAIAAGIRRIEAVAGLESYAIAASDKERLRALASKLNSPLADLEKKLDAALAQQKALEKQLAALKQKQAAANSATLLEKIRRAGLKAPAIIEHLGAADGDQLQAVADALRGRFDGVLVLGGEAEGRAHLVATVATQFKSAIQAGKIIQAISPKVDGKGGGRPEAARGSGSNPARIPEALAEAEKLLAA